jgi:hypothetical protein
LQNVILRDQGDVALARLLSFIPGASIYVDADGMVRVIDGTDLFAAEEYLNDLPPSTWDGDKSEFIQRQHIRPQRVDIHYQREVELVLEYEDDYSGQTSAFPGRNTPFIENVLPTVDPVTDVVAYDPVTNTGEVRSVPQGTWVQVDRWLEAMDLLKPEGSSPWTFDTLKAYWVHGDLDGMLGGKGLDLDSEGNVAMRIQALKQHFRQTFRINRRYMERIRDIKAIRVALLDPVTGARAPAAVWGQACVIPTTKGKLMASRTDPESAKVYRNVDYLPDAGEKLVDTPPGPAGVNIVDRDLGIFRLEWFTSPYGTTEAFIPCHLVGEADRTKPKVPTRNLAQQDTEIMGPGTKVEGGANGIFLRDTLEYKVMLTVVPAAPNNKRQFHVEQVSASDIIPLFRTELRIQRGVGPTLEVFIPPGESTARFAWDDDVVARDTVQRLLGLDSEDIRAAGIDGADLPGYLLINQDRELNGHSKAVAAELLATFADSLQGRVTTRVPVGGLKLRGNMSGATLQIAAAPSAKVNAIHEFPGQQKAISRLALMPEATRHVILGIVPFGQQER